MKYSFIIIIYLSLQSCVTQKKVERYLNENKEFSSGYCADKFKIKTDTITLIETDTLLLENYTNSIDTIVIDTSHSKEKIIKETKYRIKEIIKKTPPVIHTKIVEVENTAKIENYKLQIEDLIKKNTSLNNFKTYTYFIAFIVSALTAIILFFRSKFK
jgi:hypothetical protein